MNAVHELVMKAIHEYIMKAMHECNMKLVHECNMNGGFKNVVNEKNTKVVQQLIMNDIHS